jgi:hypothetical protein
VVSERARTPVGESQASNHSANFLSPSVRLPTLRLDENCFCGFRGTYAVNLTKGPPGQAPMECEQHVQCGMRTWIMFETFRWTCAGKPLAG